MRFPFQRDAFSGVPRMYRLAYIYLIVGNRDSALASLETVAGWTVRLEIPPTGPDPIWDPLRNNPRFQALLAKYGN